AYRQCGLFIYSDIARGSGPAIQEDMAQEGKIPPHAITCYEVWIVEDSLQNGKVHEVAVESDVTRKRIGKCLAGGDALAGKGRIDELRQHVHSGAGAANGRAAHDQIIELGFNRGAFPKVDVVGLIAAGDPQSLGFLNGVDDERVAGHGAVWDDQGRDGIFAGAEGLNIRIVRIGASRPNYQKISAAAALAHPLERSVDVCAAAHEDRAGRR